MRAAVRLTLIMVWDNLAPTFCRRPIPCVSCVRIHMIYYYIRRSVTVGFEQTYARADEGGVYNIVFI